MSKLNSDVLYLIFEQLQHDNKTIQSCLLVNRTSCEIVIPILWKNPWQYNLNYKQHLLLLNIIISNLPHELKIIYKSKGIYTLPNSYKPLFNYIKFCNYLNLEKFCSLTSIMNDKIELFINGNTRFTHIILPYDSFNFSLHNLPGSIHSLSGLEFLNCHTLKNDDILIGLAGICNSIKELKLITYLNPYFTNFKNDTENFGIIKLIENQKRLSCVQLHFVDYEYVATKYRKFFKILINSINKHSNSIKYFKIKGSYDMDQTYHLANLSLPLLKTLNSRRALLTDLTRLIGNTIGNLNEIKIDQMNHDDDDDFKRIIQIIYLNCPNLKYLKLLIRNNNILALENLLINCQNLIGLYILTSDIINWDELFKILLRSSSNNLFKFKFLTRISIKFDSLKYFLDNWDKDRHPLLLQTVRMIESHRLSCLIHEYETKGVIMKYDNDWHGTNFRSFEWIK